MKAEQLQIVQSTWIQVQSVSEAVAQGFYDRLFELDPALRPLFRGDMREQGRALMKMMDTVVSGLDRLERIVPAIQALGRRHATYGVKDPHYDTVGAALLWTLDQCLGHGFTPEVRAAWATAFGVLAATMKEAAATA